MRRIIILLLALLLAACGGAPAKKASRITINGTETALTEEQLYKMYPELRGKLNTSGSGITARSTDFFADEDYTEIKKDEYPDLYEALLEPDYKRITELIGASPNTMSTTSGGVPRVGIKVMRDGKVATKDALFFYAMKKGDLGLAEKFLKQGVDPNALNSAGHSALHLLYSKKYDIPKKRKLAELLFKYDADPGLKTKEGKSLLFLVFTSDVDDIKAEVGFLKKHGADLNQETSISSGYYFYTDEDDADETLQSRLAGSGSDSFTLLEIAFASEIEDKAGMIEFLLEEGADPDLKDKDGNTFLHKALSPRLRYVDGMSEDEIITYIEPAINNGAKVDARNINGKTPLYFSKGRLEQYLLSKGAKDYGIEAEDKAENILGLSSIDLLGMSQEQCHKLLADYGVRFKPLKDVEKVDMPVRLESPVGEIKYTHTAGSRRFSIMDCRLAAALVGWSPVLRKHGVVEVEHMRAYSPGARVGGGSKVSGHTYALAIDAAYFIFKDKSRLEMNSDWKDRTHGADPCEKPENPDSQAQAMLRSIACKTGESGIFSMILTPHYNRAHYDHLHLEVTDEVQGYVR